MSSLPNENEFLKTFRKNSSPSPINRRSPQWMNHFEINERPVSPARLELSEILKFDEEEVEKLMENLEQEVNDLDESQKLHSIRRRKKMTPDDIRSRSVIPRPKLIQIEPRSSTPVLSSKLSNIDISEVGIKKPTKIISNISEQTLFTYNSQPSLSNFNFKNYLLILFLIILSLFFFIYFYSLKSKNFKKTSLKNYNFIKHHLLTNKILQNSLSCDQNQVISLLFSGELKIMSETIKNIHNSLINYCQKQDFEVIYLLEDTKEKWKNQIIDQTNKNPFTIYILDIHHVPEEYYDFLSEIIKENEFKKSLFILLSDFGLQDFVLVRKSNLETEERDFKRIIQKQLKLNWSSSKLENLKSQLTNIVPFVHDHE